MKREITLIDQSIQQGGVKVQTTEEEISRIHPEQMSAINKSKFLNNIDSPFQAVSIKINSMWQALHLVVIVASFLDKIKQFGQQYKFKRLKQCQFSIIGDKSSDYGYYFDKQLFLNNQPSFINMCLIKIILLLEDTFLYSQLKKKLLSKIHWNYTLIMPNSMFKILWDCFILFLLTLNIFYVPIKITWENNSMGGLILSEWLRIFLNDIPGWTFLLDIIFNFNTAFYSKGVIIVNRKRIMRHYLKSKFISDLLVVIPFIISMRLNLVLLNSVLLLRTNKMFKLAQHFEQLVNLRAKQLALFNLFKLVFIIIFVAHFCGCMFFLVGSLEIDYNLQKTWIDTQEIRFVSWFEQYIISLYWAVITMVTIGYGDITPVTIYERGFVILVTLISCGVFAYSVNQIGFLIQALTEYQNQFNARMGLLTRHLSNKGVSHDLQMKVRKYFEYLHLGKENHDGELCEQMVESLSHNLLQEVHNDIRYRLIDQMPILKSNFSKDFLLKVANHIKTKRTKPEEVLIEEQQVSDKLYYLVQGVVTSYIGIKKDNLTSYTSMKQCKVLSLFDQVSFMGDLRSLTGYRTKGPCTLYYINKSDFLAEIKNFPLDQEKYQLIKDNIVIYQSHRNIGTKCTFCDKYTHSFDRCPFIKYIPYTEKLLKIYRASIQQVRMPHKRSQEKRSSTLVSLSNTKERVVNYLIENNPFHDEEELIEKLELINIVDDEEEGDFNQIQSSSVREITVKSNSPKKHFAEKEDLKDESDCLSQNSIILNDPRGISPHRNRNCLDLLINEGTQFNNIYKNYIINNNPNNNENENNYNINTSQNTNSQKRIIQNNQIISKTTQYNPYQSIPSILQQKDLELNIPINKSLPLIPLHDQFNSDIPIDIHNSQINVQNPISKKNIDFSRFQQQKKSKCEDLPKQKQKENPHQIQSIDSFQNFRMIHPNQKQNEEMWGNGPIDYSSKVISGEQQILANQLNERRNTLKLNSIDVVNQLQSEELLHHMHNFQRTYEIRKQSHKEAPEIDIYNKQFKMSDIHHEYINNSQFPSYRHSISQTNTLPVQQIPQQYISANKQVFQTQLVVATNTSKYFMPLLFLDKMKIFQTYYPSGNYPIVIEKFQALIQKFNEVKYKRFKQYVNRNVHIKHLQSLILKRSHQQGQSFNGLIPKKIKNSEINSRGSLFCSQSEKK